MFRANERLSVKKSSGAREVARLTALLRKAEMNVSSMEEKIKQKVKVKHKGFQLFKCAYQKSNQEYNNNMTGKHFFFNSQTCENADLTAMCDDLLAKCDAVAAGQS